MPAPYETVFDISRTIPPFWWVLFPLVFTAIGIGGIWSELGKRPKTKSTYFGILVVPFSLVIFFVVLDGILLEHFRLLGAYRSGQFRVVEGTVEDFVPMPYQGHASEHFRVQGQAFAYSDYTATSCFHNSSSHGGPVRANLRVRISFVARHEPCILKLEVAGH